MELSDYIKNSNRFYQGEHLKRKKSIQHLFGEGTQKRYYPLLLFFHPYETSGFPYHQVLFSVPKKHFRQATIRNTIKRRMREAYRTHKHKLYNKTDGLPFLLGYVYLSKTILPFKEIEAGMSASISYLCEIKKQ